MKELTCVAVDDQSFAISLLTDHIKTFPELNLLATFTDPLSAKDFILKNDSIDILFSDVDMPGISGIELVQSVYSRVKHIVFVTSHLRYKLNPKIDSRWHYLHKPTSLRDFEKVFLEIRSARR
jgi:two-component SAPR family response regulator